MKTAIIIKRLEDAYQKTQARANELKAKLNNIVCLLKADVVEPKRHMPISARLKIAEAQRRRWAAWHINHQKAA